jgi:multidrug efflux pump subunit AcrB
VSAATALALAVVFIYLVLASQFGSFLQPLAIMMSLPLALIGVLGGLIGGEHAQHLLGHRFIMLMGLVVKNAILLVDNANQRVREGDEPLRRAGAGGADAVPAHRDDDAGDDLRDAAAGAEPP